MAHILLNNHVNAEINLAQPTIMPEKSIAIIQTVEHESLNQARQGLMQALYQNGYDQNNNLHVIYQSAQGISSTANLIIQQFIVQNPDVIVAIGTPAAQAALNACYNANIPIVFSSVTDMEEAGLLHDQVTGSIDYPNLNDNLDLIKQFVPGIKKLGIIYSSAEVNSEKIVKELRTLVKLHDIKLIESSITNSSEVGNATAALINKVDAIYLPSDSTVFSAIKAVVKISLQNNIPVFSSDPDSIRNGVLAGIGYDQVDVGYLAGQLTAQILNGVKVKSLAAMAPKNAQLYINSDTFDILNTFLQFNLASETRQKANYVK